MKKLNKKGFTLVEMLVVIAIIAVLVAIIIPTVMSATTKAAAATNAANLRSVKAELATAAIMKDKDAYKKAIDNAPKSKACEDVDKDVAMEADPAELSDTFNGEITVTYGEKGIEYFATIAETGSAPSATPTTK